jgi:hypothetical protein
MTRLEDLKLNHCAIHGIEGQITHREILQNVGFADLKADLIPANPPLDGNARSVNPAPRT